MRPPASVWGARCRMAVEKPSSEPLAVFGLDVVRRLGACAPVAVVVAMVVSR